MMHRAGHWWHHFLPVIRSGEGVSRWWRAASIMGVVAALAAGCSGPLPGSRQGPAAAATAGAGPATPPPVATLADWQRRGATEVPPASLQRVSLGPIEVVNQTGGAVADRDARAWAEAFLRGTNYEFWAVNRLQDQFLQRSGLSTAPLTVFRPDLQDISVAQKAGSRVEYTLKVLRRLVLRTVPGSLSATFTGQFFAWKPYAFYLDAVGPATKRWTDAKGQQTTQTLLRPGEPGFELVGGELVHDPLMGDVFAFASDWDCTVPISRQRLAPLCNP
jgi:hypothetical protein